MYFIKTLCNFSHSCCLSLILFFPLFLVFVMEPHCLQSLWCLLPLFRFFFMTIIQLHLNVYVFILYALLLYCCSLVNNWIFLLLFIMIFHVHFKLSTFIYIEHITMVFIFLMLIVCNTKATYFSRLTMHFKGNKIFQKKSLL